MDIPAVLDLGAQRAAGALAGAVAPALMPLPHIRVSAEAWEEERHVRLQGEAIYAVHRADEAWWVIVVQESNTLAPGSLRMTPLSEIRCEAASGRRGG